MKKKCLVCGKEVKSRGSKRKFCSKKCMGIAFRGKNNPMYGRTWSDQKKKDFSEYKKKQYKEDPDLAYRCGSANRGVKFSEERINKMHSHRSKESYIHEVPESAREKIAKKSRDKWTPEYKRKHRETMEARGYWLPKDQIDPYKIYYKNANWVNDMIDYLNEEELSNFKKHKLYDSFNNSKGWVRDHIVPRRIGYEYNIPPEILRHPANLQFISHRSNIQKGFTDKKLTEEEKKSMILSLFKKIKEFNKEWKEQDKCLTYLTEVENF